jgi:hypothetical protein
MPTVKTTMRVVHEKAIQRAVERIVEHDLRIARHFNASRGLAENLRALGNISERPDQRNQLLFAIVNTTGSQRLFQERANLVEELKRDISRYTAKGTKELKARLGITPQADTPTDSEKPQ